MYLGEDLYYLENTVIWEKQMPGLLLRFSRRLWRLSIENWQVIFAFLHSK